MANFNNIVRELSEEERLKLLDKFNKHVTSSDVTEEIDIQNIKKINNYKDQNSYATFIYDKGSFFFKLYIKLASLFSGKNKDELVLICEVNNLKKDLKLNYPNFVNFDEARLDFGFIKEIISLVKIINNVEDKIDLFFCESFYYYSFLSDLIENGFNDKTKTGLSDLYPETLENKVEYLDKDFFLKEKDRRLKKFFSQLDMIYFEKIILQFNKFELLLKIIKFDYTNLLKNFYVLDIEESLTQNNYAVFSNVEDLVEKLFRLIYSINFAIADIGYIYELIRYSQSIPVINKKGDETTFSDEDINEIISILEKIRDLKDKIPFKQIFQYFTNDLLYKPKPVKISFNFVDIYKDYKKTLIDKLWDEHYENVRLENLNRLLKDLFKIYDFATLTFFTLELEEKVNKHCSVELKFVRKLNLITEFIKNIYKPKIEAIVNRCLIEGIFKREVSKTIISSAYYTLNASLEKIREFDLRFNEDREMGKKIYLSIKRSSSDINFKTSLMGLINDVNEDSDKLVHELYDALNVTSDFIRNLMSIENPVNMPISNLEKIRISGFPNPFVAIERGLSSFNLFFRIYKLVDDIYQ